MKYIVYFLFLISFISLEATPTTLFWTPCTTQIAPTGTVDLNADSFFSLSHSKNCNRSCYPTDVGATLGFFDWNDLSGEVGIDCFAPSEFPIYFNGKVGMDEDKLFKHAPSFAVGVFDVGTRVGKTNQNIFYAVFGKQLVKDMSLTFYGAIYAGNHAVGQDRQGYMLALEYKFNKKKDCKGKEYYKWNLSGDYASGRNFIGGGGIALTYFFNPEISFQTGPVWFNTEKYNGKWKWSIQINFNIPAFNSGKKNEGKNDEA